METQLDPLGVIWKHLLNPRGLHLLIYHYKEYRMIRLSRKVSVSYPDIDLKLSISLKEQVQPTKGSASQDHSCMSIPQKQN